MSLIAIYHESPWLWRTYAVFFVFMHAVIDFWQMFNESLPTASTLLDIQGGVALLLLLLLSRSSRVWLYAIRRGQPTRLPSLGFSRQEHWSVLPFPSPMHESEKWKWSRSVMSDSSRPHGLQPTRLLCPWDFPGKSTGVGCHCLLQGRHYW